MNEINRERRMDLDIAKGIGIIMVVWAHAEGPFSGYINQFHMPFFFFISGLLYNDKNREIKGYIKRKVESLLLPFLWWNLLFYPIFWVLYYYGNWNILKFLSEIIEILLTLNKVPFLGATWFLTSLFWISILVHIYVCKSRGHRWQDVCMLGLGVVSYTIGSVVILPYHLSRTLKLLLFYLSGYLYKKYISANISNFLKNVLACVGGIIYVCTIVYDKNAIKNSTAREIIFVTGVLGIIAFILRLSKWLEKCVVLHKISNHIAWLGKNSLGIVIWHFLAFRIAIIIQIIAIPVDVSNITAFPVYDVSGWWWMIYLVTGIYGSLLWKYILENNPFASWMKKVHMI